MNTTFSFPKLIAAILGIVWASIEPTLPYAFLCLFAVLLDCFTAFRLNRRIKRIAPNSNADGKLKSSHMSKMITDLLVVWLCMLLANGVDEQILAHWGDLHLAQYVAAIFILTTAVSIAENESTAKTSTWARLLQKIVASKLSRHTDIPEEELLDILKESSK